MGSQVTGKILGIDAGGTFTDLALLSEKELSVEDFVKVSTNKENMADTIKTGLKQILEKTGADGIRSISLATTFATNALVENKVRETALILIGYDPERVEAARRHGKFPTERIITISGGHDMKGNEKAALDIEALVPWLNENIPHVESVAVSAFFSVRNPSHELRIRELIYSMFNGKYVTCGHELTSDLDAMLRAVTASLNANLIPIIIDLFESVEKVFRNEGIAAPISVVKSDGTLVGLEWAKLHPIETILSGPAASAVGANHLACAGKLGKPSWVVDIGGTTTDIIHLDAGGSPALRAEGATIGSHKTLIKTIDIYTFGLGGDSRIYGKGRDGRIVVGPGRVSPLCRCLMENHVIGAAALNTTVFFDEPIIIIPADAGDFYDDFDIDKAMDIVKSLNIDINEKLKTMSKGTKEKVQLILVMSRHAKLYILDEPIGGVDPAARTYILKTIITNYCEDSTLLIATHLISEIENICDDVIFISNGNIVLQGNVDEIREEKGKSIDALFREEFKC